MDKISKYLAFLLILFGVVTLWTEQSDGAELPLLVGLFMLFVSRTTLEDERTVILKSSSAYIALVIGYGFKLLATNLYSHQLISFHLTEINHFLILVFVLANSIFYLRFYFFWK
jgi:hypothetical protein